MILLLFQYVIISIKMLIYTFDLFYIKKEKFILSFFFSFRNIRGGGVNKYPTRFKNQRIKSD